MRRCRCVTGDVMIIEIPMIIIEISMMIEMIIEISAIAPAIIHNK